MFKSKAFRTALAEFATMFGAIIVWNFVRKNSESLLDGFGESFIAAVLLYFLHHERK
jgi:hypothetical protein